jgi:hypothetical protein
MGRDRGLRRWLPGRVRLSHRPSQRAVALHRPAGATPRGGAPLRRPARLARRPRGRSPRVRPSTAGRLTQASSRGASSGGHRNLVLEITPPTDDKSLLHGLLALWPSYLATPSHPCSSGRCGLTTTSCSTTIRAADGLVLLLNTLRRVIPVELCPLSLCANDASHGWVPRGALPRHLKTRGRALARTVPALGP